MVKLKAHNQIQDRILRFERVKASSLIPNPRNWRRHPESQRAALRGVLVEIGYADALLVRETSEGLQLVDGHLRAETTPDQEVPVLVLDVTEEEANKLLLTLDPLAAMAQPDQDALLSLLADTQFADKAVNDMLEALVNGETQPMPMLGLTDPDDVPEVPQESYVKRGDIYQLGEHRMICGDSEQVKEIQRLLNGSKVNTLISDPPYGYGVMETDIAPSMGILSDFIIQYRTVALFGYPEDMVAFCVNSKVIPKEWITWYPPNKPVAMGGILCKSSEVIAIWGWVNKQARLRKPRSEQGKQIAEMTGRRDIEFGKEHDVWCDASPFTMFNASGRLHPNQKPVSLIEKLIRLCSDAKEIILDLFLGSGTTLIACERLGRVCYSMEIKPAYVQVSIERWQNYTGRKAEKVS